MTDMISLNAFRDMNFPYTKQLVDEIRNHGLKSIYYFAGNPTGRIEQILQVGADAVSFEESKKNFQIDIEDIISQVRGQCTVLGNLDSIGVLQNGTEEQLRNEISRQISAGKNNNSRFIMSLGSPPTPQTPVTKV